MLSNISKLRSLRDLYKLPLENQKSNCKISRSIKLLLLNAPCNGFGDLIFLKKLAEHLRKTFKINITIATTEPEKLMMLGEQKKYVKKLASSNDPLGTVRPCRVFHDLRMFDLGKKTETSTDKYDVFFIAPLSFDYDPKLSDVKPLVPKATRFNTFFFSEYNDSIKKDFDFHTGVGKGRDGLLLTTPAIESSAKINRLVNRSKSGPYCLIYIADLDDAMTCIKGFLELVSKKYNHHRRFQIIIPPFLVNTLGYSAFLPKVMSKYWGTIKIIGKNDSIDFTGDGSSSLTIRGDILPVKNNVMLGLIKNSERDILLTGDQSITDALSCCHNKNIFYQIAPWKTNFGKEMANAMPNKYLKSVKTSCGNLSAINYKSNYTKFVRNNNFFKNAHNKLQSILCMATTYRNKSSDTHKLINIVNESKTLAQVKKKVKYLDKYPDKYPDKKKSHRKSRRKSNHKSRRKSRRKSSIK